MSHSIEYFMWGFQSHFQAAVEFTVERVIGQFARSVDPRVFVIGFLRGGGTRHPICVEPDDVGVAPDDLASVPGRAGELLQADPDRAMWNSDARVHERFLEGLRDRAWRTAVAEVLEGRLGGRFFVTSSVDVEQHRVFVAIGLPKEVVDSFPALTSDRVDDSRIVLTRSLLEASMRHLLSEVVRALYQPDPGSTLGPLVDADEIARVAGEALAMDTAYRADSREPAHGFFGALNRVTTTTYERRTGRGRLLVASPGASGVDRVLMLERPVPMAETRALRKLLETSRGDGLALLTNGSVAYGLGDFNATYDVRTESVFEVVVSGTGSWELCHAKQPLMVVNYGVPSLSEPRVHKSEVENLATRIFGREACRADRLWDLAEAASEAEHGTMLVVSSGAASEASRLQAQALVVEPKRLEPALVKQVTTIDGAVLVDPHGVLAAIGVILDGTATPEGDRSRGARFNSAVRYLSSAPHATMIMLMSEDGMIDLLPKRSPRIRRTDVVEALEGLQEAGALEPVVNAKKFSRALDRVRHLAFYLTAQQCQTVNELVEAHWRRRRDAGANIWIIETPLSPSPSMSDEYFIE